MQIGQRNGAEHSNTQPVKRGFHQVEMDGLPRHGKQLRQWVVLCAALLVVACDGGTMSKQAVAVIDGVEITQRELEQELRMQGMASVDVSQSSANAVLDSLIDRKILAAEARTRGLQTDGEYHFARRRADEQLLAEALGRSHRKALPAPAAQAVARRLEQQPWRYARRAMIVIQRADLPDASLVTLDSAEIGQAEARALEATVEGGQLSLGGLNWRLVQRTPYSLQPEVQAALATRDLQAELTQRKNESIIRTYRENGRVRYKYGFGPGAS